MISLIRGIIFYIGYALSIIFYGLIVTPLVWFLPYYPRYRALTTWPKVLSWWLNISCGIRYEIENPEDLPNEICVVVANHQSTWEAFMIPQFLPTPLSVAAKKELFYIPLVGLTLKALEPIIIDRSQKQNALKQLITQGKQSIANNIGVLIFPEGTRVPYGESHPHLAGGSMLAIQSKVPILPLVHNSGLFWPAGKANKYPGTIKIRVGKLIDTNGRKPKELTKEIEEWMTENMPR